MSSGRYTVTTVGVVLVGGLSVGSVVARGAWPGLLCVPFFVAALVALRQAGSGAGEDTGEGTGEGAGEGTGEQPGASDAVREGGWLLLAVLLVAIGVGVVALAVD